MNHRFQHGAAVALATLALSLGACADMSQGRRASIVKDVACADFSFPVYFKDNADELTTAAAQAIAESAGRTKRCHVEGLTIIGLTGDLAARRADAIARAFAANGLSSPTPLIDAGEPGAGANPMMRRTEVRVRLNGPT